MAATTSFGLDRIGMVSSRSADCLVGSMIIRTRNHCPAPCRKHPRQPVSFSTGRLSSTVRTRMYSQFSEVKFSSVALAADDGQPSCLHKLSQTAVDAHQQRRQKRSAELGT
jgi:hypothetical protein